MKQLLQIGRAKDNDIILTDPSVSKQHAQLVIHAADDVGIVDLGSTNGTMVNGKRIQGFTKLQPGDKVHLGNQLLTWRTYVQEFAGAFPSEKPAQVEKPQNPATKGASQRQTASLPPQSAPQQPMIVQVQAPPQRSSGLGTFGWIVILVLVFSLGAFGVLKYNGVSLEAALAKPKTYGLSVQCGGVTNLVVMSEVTLLVQNRSQSTHDGVTVRVTGFDKDGREVVSKLVTYALPIEPGGDLPKMVSLPAKVRTCDCEVVDSSPR
jgi:hypothetical protein